MHVEGQPTTHQFGQSHAFASAWNASLCLAHLFTVTTRKLLNPLFMNTEIPFYKTVELKLPLSDTKPPNVDGAMTTPTNKERTLSLLEKTFGRFNSLVYTAVCSERLYNDVRS